MQETAPARASLDTPGSREGAAAREVPAAADHSAAAGDPAVFERPLDLEKALLDDLRAQLSRAAAAHSDAEARHRSAMAAAAEQLADQKTAYEIAMARNAAIWEMVDEQLREAALEVERARQSRASAAADVDRATRRAAELEAQTAGEIERRHELEQTLARAERAHEDAEARHTTSMAEAAARANELELALQFANGEIESRAAEIQRLTDQEASLTSQIAQAVAGRAELERQLQVTRTAIQEADARATRERLAASRKAADREAELEGQLRLARESRAALERESRAALERAAADAEAAGREQQERHRQALADAASEAADRRARFEHDLSEATSARDAAIERLQSTEGALDQLRRDHELTTAHAARLSQHEAELLGRVSDQKAAIEALERRVAQAESAIEDAARREESLDGDLRQEREERSGLETDLAKLRQTVAAADEQARHAENERNAVGRELDATRQRLEAAESEASQMPRLRERLELAQRMEAIGRLASEAAATCGNLLADVHQNVQQWLVATSGDALVRQRGESVLDDVTRVAGLIRQLAGYADEHGREPAADLGTIIRDLEPLLKRVAGLDVEIALPEDLPPLRLDVSSERVERLLVNLASYGRERMPDGGRLRIELDTVVVDGDFTARHASVRAGAHALVTMTKSQPRDDDQLRNGAANRPRRRFGGAPGLELGTLQALVGECGGYLWMTIEPQGNIVSKLHLPLAPGQ